MLYTLFRFRRRLVIALSCALLLAMSLPLTMLPRTAFADGINPGVLAINGQVGGLTYGQWSARWWQYAFSVTTFANCPVEPSGQMWFLAGTTGGPATRSCTVPAGKNIMFPLFNVEWSVAEAQANGNACIVPASPSGTSDAALQACATAQANHATAPGAELEAEVDGKTLQSLTNYRAVSPPFTFTAVDGNPFGLCPADGPCPLTSRAVADGFWIILDPPLSAGKHTIHFLAQVPFPELNFTFKTETTYLLTVQSG